VTTESGSAAADALPFLARGVRPAPDVREPATGYAASPTAGPAAGHVAGSGPETGSWLGLRDLEREGRISALFDRHHTELVRLAVLLGAAGDAEDVVAEAFCELYRRWARLRDPGAAPAYLRSVVCNLVRMRLRHLQMVRRHVEPLPLDVGSAEQEVVVREDHREVVDALRALPDRQRQALVLRYWLDLKESEVAAAMGISAGAVKSHTSRGMAALTRMLEARR
jgi:RNA polymerase sigma-70 factor (sigma-E family)